MGFKVLSLWSLGFRDWWGFVLRDRRDFVGSTGIGVLFFLNLFFPTSVQELGQEHLPSCKQALAEAT